MSRNTGNYVANFFPAWLFPRLPWDMFDLKELPGSSENKDELKLKAEIKETPNFERIRNGDSNYNQMPIISSSWEDNSEGELEARERDFLVFLDEDGQLKKDMTVCFLNKEGNGKYTIFKKTPGNFPQELAGYGIRLSVEENQTGKDIFLQHDSAPRMGDIRGLVFSLEFMNENCMFSFSVNIKNEGNTESLAGKTFQVKVETLVKAGADIMTASVKTITLKIWPYKGWKLTTDGELRQGATGYLIDENGYYILEDGRRVSDEMIIESRYGEKDIRIGDKDVSKGLSEILGKTDSAPVKTVYNDVYEELFKSSQSAMPLVVYQAFQINACYAKPNSIQNPLAIGDNAKFYSIGTDETAIPIVVTQAGEDGPDKKKLVIAGPHGDERNAQRLIMAVQKYFIDKNLPADTVLYFIPCLSPTMCFADARGIPVVDKDGKRLPIPEAKRRTTIPYLHNLIASQVPKNPDVPDDTALLRTLMQSGNGKATDDGYPKYGIDANRDINFDLKSNIVFKSFIVNLYRGTNTSRKIETEVKIYDPEDRIYHKMDPQFTAANMQVFMIHGYFASGMIYGPYFCKEKEPRQSWPAAMSDTDKDRVNTMLGLFFGRLNQRKYSIGPNSVRGTNDDPHLYEETEYDARDYQGEWVKVLPGIGIWSIDIELPGRFAVQSYDEGIRNDDTGERPYGPLMVGDLSKELFKMEEENRFVKLIKDRAIWP